MEHSMIMEALNMVIGGLAFLGGVALTLVGAYAHKVAIWAGGLGTVTLGLIVMGITIVI
jgi:hypothetical protein